VRPTPETDGSRMYGLKLSLVWNRFAPVSLFTYWRQLITQYWLPALLCVRQMKLIALCPVYHVIYLTLNKDMQFSSWFACFLSWTFVC